MKKYLIFSASFFFACVHSFAGVLEEFNIEIAKKDNSLIISGAVVPEIFDFKEIVDSVLLQKIRTADYSSNAHKSSSYNDAYFAKVRQEDGSIERVLVEPHQTLEYVDFFAAPSIINSATNPEEWINLIREEFEKN